MDKTMMSRATSKSLSVVLAAAALLIVLLAGCFSPLQTEETGLVIPLGFVSALETFENGSYSYAMDIYIYRASDASMAGGEVFEIREGASPVPIGGRESYRISAMDMPEFQQFGGYTARTASVPSVPAGGPYVLYVQVLYVENGEEFLYFDVATFNWELGLITFSIESGKTTVLPEGSLQYLNGW